MKELYITLGACLGLSSTILNATTNIPSIVLLYVSLTGLTLCIIGYFGMKKVNK